MKWLKPTWALLTTGRRSYTYANRLYVMPIDRLWQPATLLDDTVT